MIYCKIKPTRSRFFVNIDNMRKQKVLVAMSGGLDSSVAALLLKKQGFEVSGVFMRFYSEPENQDHSSEAAKRAARVASILDIPLLVLDLRKEFKKSIVDWFLNQQEKGETPNPCVLCNKVIKFKFLIKKAAEIGADFVATGHYARKRETKDKASRRKIYQLLKGKDKAKDQSYFLWMLGQAELKKILFPIGVFRKEKVRGLARRFGLPVINIPESQEICFIETSTSDFLKKHLPEKPGRIVNSQGKTIGNHQGLFLYTIGQRKSIGLPDGPYYVLKKDLENNILFVTKNKKDLGQKALLAQKINWVSGRDPRFPLKVRAKIRYGHEESSAVLSPLGGRAGKRKSGKICVVFQSPQSSITPGQSVVFYRKDEVLGGGIISSETLVK